MASEYLIKTVNEYEDYIKNHEIDGQVLNAYVMATQTAICTEHDIKYGVKVSNRAKEIINYLIKKQSGGTFAQLEDFAQENKTEFELINIYYKLLKMEAPDVLDSYMLYVEKNRKRRDRFYEPRRKTLKLVTDKLQLLEDDELDELFVHMPARVGKLLSDDTDVLTSKGWKKHGKLKVGDKVVGSDGKFTKVVKVFPKNQTTHTVTMSDGTKIDCHFRHEWTVFDRRSSRYRTVETKDLIGHLKNGERNNFMLPSRPIMQGTKKKLNVHPYVLGAWLGDGTTRAPKISGDKKDDAIIKKINDCGYRTNKKYIHKTTGVISTTFFGLAEDLRTYELCKRTHTKEKFIPKEYITASIEQRLELLAGLLDTDGCLVRKERRYQFTTCSEKLRDGVCELVSTFGWRISVKEVKPRVSSSGIVGKKTYWVVAFNPTIHIPCVLKRKQLFEFSTQKRISIESIEKSENKVGNCISVENQDGIYLVSKNMLPTHNSQELTLATSWKCARNTEASNLYVTYKEGLGGAFLDGVIEIWTDPIYCFSDIFPKAIIVDTDAKNNKVDLQRKKKYKSLSGKGLTSGLNGEYDAYGWLIIDDILEGIQDVLNPDILRRKQIIFDNNVMKRKKEKCKVVYNGTIWSLKDIYMNRRDFLENNPEAQDIRFDVLKIPALDPETDESNFDYDYGVGFSTKYYRIERAKFEENDDMAGWYAQCQQEPIERDGAVFSQEHMKFYNGVLPAEEPYRICAACDVALGGEDYLAFAVAYMYEDGSIYIDDAIFDNSEKKITKPKVVDMIIDHNIGSAYFEANQGGEGYKDEVDTMLREKGHKINLVSQYAPTSMRKTQRIWDKAGSIREWYFRDTGCRSQEYRAFMRNLFSFTIKGKNKHEDAPDCLASLAYFIEGTWEPSKVEAVHNPFRGGYR